MSHPPLVEPDAGREPERDQTAAAPSPDVEPDGPPEAGTAADQSEPLESEPAAEPDAPGIEEFDDGEPYDVAYPYPDADRILPDDGTEPRRLPLVGQVGRLTYGLLALGMAVLVGVVGWFGFTSFGTGSPHPVGPAETAAATAPPTSTAVDPYQFLAVGSATPARAQPCDGLLGLCLGQRMAVATAAFGRTEVEGYPRPTESGGQCHGWRTPTTAVVRVCEIRDAIVAIRVDAPAGTRVRLAAPRQLLLDLPDPAAAMAQDITTGLPAQPYGSEYLRSGGESVFSFSWYLSAAAGTDRGRLRIVARQTSAPGSLPTPCPGGPGYYPYQRLVPLSAGAPTTSVEVAVATFQQTGTPPADC